MFIHAHFKNLIAAIPHMCATTGLPKYKVYFRTTCINVSTLICNSLFSSSSAATRCCSARVGSGALVVAPAGSWAARSMKKLCFIAVQSCHSTLV